MPPLVFADYNYPHLGTAKLCQETSMCQTVWRDQTRVPVAVSLLLAGGDRRLLRWVHGSRPTQENVLTTSTWFWNCLKSRLRM